MTPASSTSDLPWATAAELAEVVSAHTYRYRHEVDLHRGLEAALRVAGFDPRPEVRVPGGRIDFVVGRVGIEVKVDGSLAALTRQVTRYTQNGDLDEFLVITTRTQHRGVPALINTKPVTVIVIGRFA